MEFILADCSRRKSKEGKCVANRASGGQKHRKNQNNANHKDECRQCAEQRRRWFLWRNRWVQHANASDCPRRNNRMARRGLRLGLFLPFSKFVSHDSDSSALKRGEKLLRL